MESSQLNPRNQHRTQSEKDDGIRIIFENFLRGLRFVPGHRVNDRTSFFFVYAHDNEEVGPAKEEVVHRLISWSKEVWVDAVSDKSSMLVPREGGTAVASNIFDNQICLLLLMRSPNVDKSIVGSVDKVVFCISKVMKKYFSHPFANGYIQSLIKSFNASCDQFASKDEIIDRLWTIVNRHCQDEGFHHVLTEIAFLQLRCQRPLKGGPGIIPVLLEPGDMGDLSCIPDELTLKLSPEPFPPYQNFFKLLGQLFPHKLDPITIFRDEFTKAVKKFEALAIGSEKSPGSPHHQKILARLPSIDHVESTQKKNLRTRQGQTGEWILKHQDYVAWKAAALGCSSKMSDRPKARTLWLHGARGVGKTILSSIIIDDLSRSQLDSSIGVAYEFCRFGKQQDAPSLTLSLIAQLLTQHTKIPASLVRVAAEHRHEAASISPDTPDCKEIIDAVISQFHKVFLVVDGLDEVSEEPEAERFLGILLNSIANVLIMSQRTKMISSLLSRVKSIPVEASPRDIAAYIRSRLRKAEARPLRDVMKLHDHLRPFILETLTMRANKHFLLAQLNMDFFLKSIGPCSSHDRVIEALENTPLSLKKVHGEYMNRIMKSDHPRIAQNLLAWVLYARQPVSLLLVQEAISILLSGHVHDHVDDDRLLDSCLGLVVKTDDSKQLSFVHLDARSFFSHVETSAQLDQWIPNGEAPLAEACFKCMLSGDSRLQEGSHLWHYATVHWGYHISSSTTDSLALRFLSSSELVSISMNRIAQNPQWKTQWCDHSIPCIYNCPNNIGPSTSFEVDTGHPIPSKCEGIHAVAFFGLEAYILHYGKAALEQKDSNGWTPLWWAVVGVAPCQIVPKLLRMEAKVNVESNRPTQFALWIMQSKKQYLCKHGQAQVIRASKGVDLLDAHYSDYILPCLCYLEMMCHGFFSRLPQSLILQIIQRLKQDELNAFDGNRNTLLMTAAANWQLQVVRDLLQRGANNSLRNTAGELAFNQMLKSQDTFSLYRDFEIGGDARILIGNNYSYPGTITTYSSTFTIRQESAERLIVNLIPDDFDANTSEGVGAFAIAISNRYNLVVERLFERGADVNARNRNRMTPLQLACSPPVIHNIRLESFSCSGSSILQVGNFLGIRKSIPERILPESFEHLSLPLPNFDWIVKFLIRNGARVNDSFLKSKIHETYESVGEYSKDPTQISYHTCETSSSALSAAVENEYLTLVRELLQNHADISKIDESQIKHLKRLLRGEESSNRGWVSIDTSQGLDSHDYQALLTDFPVPPINLSITNVRSIESSKCVLDGFNVIPSGQPPARIEPLSGIHSDEAADLIALIEEMEHKAKIKSEC